MPRLRRGIVWRWGLVGGVLGLGAPAGLWLLLRLAEPGGDQVLSWVYAYTAVSTSLVFGAFGVVAGTLIKGVNAAAIRDDLTDLHNRRYVLDLMPRLAATARRRERPLCLLMLDLDRFKRVNDEFGHDVGDRTLEAFAEVIRTHVRKSDIAARWGGEEFVIVCPDSDARSGLEVAERLRLATAALGEDTLGHGMGQTVSLGVAVYDPKQGPLDIDDLLRRADAALYAAKARGRNQAVFDPTDEAGGPSTPDTA